MGYLTEKETVAIEQMVTVTVSDLSFLYNNGILEYDDWEMNVLKERISILSVEPGNHGCIEAFSIFVATAARKRRKDGQTKKQNSHHPL